MAAVRRKSYMGYMDETVLKMREEKKKEKYATLEDGIYMDGEIITFSREILFGEISVFLPQTMEEMPEAYARVKYPSEFRPRIILTTLDLGVNLGFTVFPKEMPCEDIRAVAERMMAAVRRANPDYRLYPPEELKETEGYFFPFRSHAMDSDLYNMMLAAVVGGKFVQGSFNCRYGEHKKWKETVRMIWESVLPAEKEE